MRSTISSIGLFIIVISIASACSSPVTTPTPTLAVSSAEPTAPVSTATSAPEPSLTPTPALLALEIIEWSEWPYGNPADPSNTDTHVEVLIRNPNNFPVRVNLNEAQLRFINTAGEVVYTNPSAFFYIWQGEWMLPGETAALSACVCFMTSGLEKQDWESLELIAPLEIADDIAYTLDVEVTLGEVIDLAATHLGGTGLGLETTLTNTSDQVLESIPHRVLARDASGRFVGVAFAGDAVVSFTENIGIQPGDTATGINVIEIDYIDMNVPLSYEVAAIGIPVQPESALPSDPPLAEWKGIPVMPGAISGEIAEDGYQFTTLAGLGEIKAYYQTELSNLGFEVELTADETTGYVILEFRKGDTTGMIAAAPVGGLQGVLININP